MNDEQKRAEEAQAMERVVKRPRPAPQSKPQRVQHGVQLKREKRNAQRADVKEQLAEKL